MLRNFYNRYVSVFIIPLACSLILFSTSMLVNVLGFSLLFLRSYPMFKFAVDTVIELRSQKVSLKYGKIARFLLSLFALLLGVGIIWLGFLFLSLKIHERNYLEVYPYEKWGDINLPKIYRN